MTGADLLKHINPEEYRFSNLEKFLAEIPSTSSGPIEILESDRTLIILDGKIHRAPEFEGLTINQTKGAIDIKLAKNILLEHPLKIQYINKKLPLNESVVKVLAGSNSKLCIIEESSGGTLTQIHFDLEVGARVEHIQIGQGTKFNHSDAVASLAKDANFRNFIFNLEGEFSRRNIEIRLNESGCHAESYCLYLLNQKEHSDIFTKIEHLSPDTTSEQLAKGILDDNSKGIFTGKIHIHPDAQRVYSSQLNKNLLLSKKAQAHSQPQLEIFADDVKCSHGSTTGQLSDDEIFYFESRGIPHEKARTLLSWAFAMEVVNKVKNREALDYISKRVESDLEGRFKLKGIQ
jgi:Fe-S cluster assembly protein SufD